MKKTLTILIVSLILCTNVKANLIDNGDFEQGNTGFTTNYTYTDEKPNGLWPEGCYALGSDPVQYHELAASYGDHTSGQGNMMIVNGKTTSNITLWEQTISVASNTDYEFSIWLSNWAEFPCANLEYFINDISIGNSYAPDTTGQWIEYSQIWQSGQNTEATVKIVNLETAYIGNDFAIDDICLNAIPEPATLALLGLGAFVLRKRK